MIRIRLRHATIHAFLALPLLVGSPALGQNLTHGVIEGTVRDSTGMSLDAVMLTLRDRASGTTRTMTTARDGRFEFVLLLPGSYELLSERFGFMPKRLLGVPVAPGERLDLSVTLSAEASETDRVEEVRFEASRLSSRVPGSAHLFGDLELLGLPTEGRELTWLSGLSSAGGAGLEVQGLPSHLSGVYVDGFPVFLARHPSAARGTLGAAHLALSAFDRAELVTGGMDVEWAGAGGAILSGHTRRGTPELRVEAFGDWAGGAEASVLPGFPVPTAGAPGTYRAMQGGFLVTGPIARDTAGFAAGLEVWRVETTPGAGGVDSLASRVAAIAADSYGVTLSDAASSVPLRSDALSGFLRTDWRITETHQLSLRSSFATLPQAQETLAALPGHAWDGRFEGSQFAAGADLVSRLGEQLYQEIRIGGDFVSRVYSPDPRLDLPGGGLARTRILADGWSYGTGAGLLGGFQQASLRGSETLYFRTGAHRLKLGLSAAVHSYDFRYDESRSGKFVFSGLSGFASGEGAFVQTLTNSPEAEFTVPQFGAFLQDSWRVGPGLEIVAGARFDAERLPRDEVTTNTAWLERTGLDNADFRATSMRFSPRLRFAWDLLQDGRWRFAAGAGLFTGSPDPSLLGDLLSHDGSVEVRRGLGTLESWPLLPDSSVAPLLGPRLVLLAPGFAAPRTARVNVGLSHAPGARTGIHLSSAYRRTDFLPRRHDLNLLSVAVGEDQYGRPLFGTLRQQGRLLMAENLSNRRFPEFEQALAVDVDGWSEYRGVTLAVEHRPDDGIRLSASYTASRTRDNWPTGHGGGGEPAPVPETGQGAAWTEGISDLDVPHRAVLGFAASAPGIPGIRVAGLYRYRSGYPFTPGFGEGVDANADGSFGNDPAFVDSALPGMAELLEAWPCLRDSVGRFATRNACRGPDVHALDLRLSLRIGRAEGAALELLVDALNLTAAEDVFLDRALYLVDESAEAVVDPVTGTVRVPLRVNPSFGQPLVRLGAGRVFRLGLRMTY